LVIEQCKSHTLFNTDADGDEFCACPKLLSVFRVQVAGGAVAVLMEVVVMWVGMNM
jgi:hypothetical protein